MREAYYQTAGATLYCGPSRRRCLGHSPSRRVYSRTRWRVDVANKEWVDATIAAMRKLESLAAGWDGPGSLPVSPLLMDTVEKALRAVSDTLPPDLPPAFVAPLSHGEFQIEINSGERFIELVFDNVDTFIAFTDEREWNDVMTYSMHDVENLSGLIARFRSPGPSRRRCLGQLVDNTE